MAVTIYVGPNDKKRGLRQYQRFVEDYPQHIMDLLSKEPLLGRYFMDFDTFVSRKPPGSPAENVNYVAPVIVSGPPIAKKSTISNV